MRNLQERIESDPIGRAVITGLLFWMLADTDDDEDESPPTTGTN